MFPALVLAAVLGRNEVLVCAVVAEAERQGLDPYVVCALVEVESGFNPRAKGKGGDYGLFQIHPRWHGTGYRRVGDNVAKGCSILRGELTRCHGAIDSALGRYNAGSNYRRGAKYSAKVLTLAARLKAQVRGRQWKQPRLSLLFSRVVCFWHLWCPEYAPRRGKKGRGRASA